MRLRIEPLTDTAFKAFGDVVAMPLEGGRSVNFGTATRFDDVASLDLSAEGGRPLLSLFRADPPPRPLRVRMLERHPLSTQFFMPLSRTPFLVVVGEGETSPDPNTVRAFRTDGRQGVNFRRGVWHHPLLVLETGAEFLVLGRAQRGPGDDLDEACFPDGLFFEIDG
jgi:ureidoglycolate lyase